EHEHDASIRRHVRPTNVPVVLIGKAAAVASVRLHRPDVSGAAFIGQKIDAPVMPRGKCIGTGEVGDLLEVGFLRIADPNVLACAATITLPGGALAIGD